MWCYTRQHRDENYDIRGTVSPSTEEVRTAYLPCLEVAEDIRLEELDNDRWGSLKG